MTKVDTETCTKCWVSFKWITTNGQIQEFKRI